MASESYNTIMYKKKPGYKMIRQYMMGELLGEGSQGKARRRPHPLVDCGL
jgi:hypothetical protein